MAVYKDEINCIKEIETLLDNRSPIDVFTVGVIKHYLLEIKKELDNKNKTVERYKVFFEDLNSFLPSNNSNPIF